MNKKKELAKNTIVLLIGKICTTLISFFLLPLYTNVLSTSEFGTADLILTYIGLLAPVITLQLEMASFRYLVEARNDVYKTSKIISSILSIVLSLLFIFSLLWLLITYYFHFKYSLYLIMMIIMSSIVGIFMQFARGLGDSIGYSISCVISGGLNVILNVVFLLFLKLNISGMFLAYIISNLLAIIFLMFRINIIKYFSLKNTNDGLKKELLKYSIPLIPNCIVWWIINVSDRSIISLFLSASANGIYAISNKFSNFLINVYNVYNMSWTESLSLHLNDDDNFISDMINKSLLFFASVLILIISFMPLIFVIFIGNDYAEAYYYIPILLVSTYFNIFASLLGALYIALKNTSKLSLSSFYAGIINIVINILLIKYIGLYAAAISTVIAFMAISFYRYFDIKKKVPLKIKFKDFRLTIIILIIVLISYYFSNIYSFILSCIISSILFLNINISAIKKVVNKFIPNVLIR